MFNTLLKKYKPKVLMRSNWQMGVVYGLENSGGVGVRLVEGSPEQLLLLS